MLCNLDISSLHLPLSWPWIKEGRVCTWEQGKAKKPRAFAVVEIGTAPCIVGTLQRQNAENLIQIFPEKEYGGLSPNFHIHVSVSELYIPTMGLPFLLEEISVPILGIYKSLTDTLMWKLGLRPRNSQKRNI
jgi:hypothetical protein